MPHLGDKSIDFVISDSIRCEPGNGGYPGSNQGESGLTQIAEKTQVLLLISKSADSQTGEKSKFRIRVSL
jgi:hypothetical protein